MVLFLGMFLVNTLCAIVPCQKLYDPPIPVSKGLVESKSILQPFRNEIRIPILQKDEGLLIIKTKNGYVQGFKMKTIKNRDIFAWTSIPYAVPPINELRYRPPVSIKKKWKGILQATKTSSVCLQVDPMSNLRIKGSEDCLYANIYTPILPRHGSDPKLQVFIFFHGGSFAFGGGSSFGPSYLLGFLTTGDEAAPGNWGLKDQNLLIRWVHENIHAFGGDPSQIVLWGQSAGGVSVHLQILSKQSPDLRIKSAISQSGNAFCFWAVRDKSIQYSYRLANALRCPVNNSSEMVSCLRKVDPFLIMYTEANLPNYKVFPGVFFGPVIEPASEDAFLEERPEILYAQNKVPPIPWINGFLAGEGNGIGFLAWLYPLVMQEMDKRWLELGPSILDIDGDLKHMSRVVSYIRQFYFGDKAIDFYSREQLSKMMGDRLIMTAVHKGLKYHSRVAPTYGYYFNYTGRYGHAAAYGLKNTDWGISHDDDLIYLLNSTTYQALTVGEPEYEMSEFLANIWSSFAINGEPTYVTREKEQLHFWDPIQSSSKNNISILLINGELPKMIPFPFLKRVKFWDDMNLISRSKVGPYTIMSMPKKQTF